MGSVFQKSSGDMLMSYGRAILHFLQKGRVGLALNEISYVQQNAPAPITTADLNDFKAAFSPYIKKYPHKHLRKRYMDMIEDLQENIIWTHPNIGMKLNTDGSGSNGIGAIIRGPDGLARTAFVQHIPPGSSSTDSECLALWGGMDMASKFLYAHPEYRNLPLVVESDLKDLIENLGRVCRGGKTSWNVESRWGVKALYNNFMRRHPGMVLDAHHVYRGGNACADVLASFGTKIEGYEMKTYTGDECHQGACDGLLKHALDADLKYKVQDTYEGEDEESD